MSFFCDFSFDGGFGVLAIDANQVSHVPDVQNIGSLVFCKSAGIPVVQVGTDEPPQLPK